MYLVQAVKVKGPNGATTYGWTSCIKKNHLNEEIIKRIESSMNRVWPEFKAIE